MTRYDPFAYGEVRLDPNQQKQSGGTPSDVDDLLFADAESVKQAPPADSSWSQRNREIGDVMHALSPNAAAAVDFGADILGEDASSELPLDDASPGMQPSTGVMGVDLSDAGMMGDVAPATASMPPLENEPSDSAVQPRQHREVRRRRISVPESQGQVNSALAASAKSKSSTQAGRRRMRALAALTPLLLCAGGGTAVAWFWVMQANPVMAGILGAATLVSALFSWLFLRG